jgi:hypothetical protein
MNVNLRDISIKVLLLLLLKDKNPLKTSPAVIAIRTALRK